MLFSNIAIAPVVQFHAGWGQPLLKSILPDNYPGNSLTAIVGMASSVMIFSHFISVQLSDQAPSFSPFNLIYMWLRFVWASYYQGSGSSSDQLSTTFVYDFLVVRLVRPIHTTGINTHAFSSSTNKGLASWNAIKYQDMLQDYATLTHLTISYNMTCFNLCSTSDMNCSSTLQCAHEIIKIELKNVSEPPMKCQNDVEF